MEEAPLPSITPKTSISETFEIEQNQKIYKLAIEIINQDISIFLEEEKAEFEQYETNLNYEELTKLHKAFSILPSCQDFLEYIKASIKNNKLSVKKEQDNKISIEIIFEYLFKQSTVKIDLKEKKINLESVVKNMFKQLSTVNERLIKIENGFVELQEENKSLKEENRLIKEENNNLKTQNKIIKEENKVFDEKIINIHKILDRFNKEIFNW